MSRIRVALDGIWDFYPDPQQRLAPDRLEESERRAIRVPGPWQAQFEDLRDYAGVAWYATRFTLPDAARAHSPDRSAFVLHFGAVDYYTTVWLNGRELGENEGGYLPFELSASDAIRLDGENELVVRVVDPGDDLAVYPQYAFAETPHGKQSWYGPVGGIWQSVYLEVRHSVYFTRLHITPDISNEQAQVELLLNEPLKQERAVRVTLTDPNGRARQHDYVVNPGEKLFQSTLLIPNPLLWDTRSPDLYRVEASLLGEDGTELDTYSSHFGMREISASADGHLLLNGRVVYLRGALDQDYYPELVYTPFSDAELDAQFQKARHMGLNCLRTHIKIADPRYYDAADRNGILIWSELPNWSNLTPAVKQRARKTLTGMVERDWNHPSIIVWTIVNEGWGVDLAVNADHRAWVAETYDFMKQLDPHRLVVGNSACLTNLHVVTDIADFHNYYSIPDHYREWRDWVRNLAERPSWIFAHPYEGIESWREYLRDPWNPRLRTLAPEVRRTGSEPIVVSEFGNWGLPEVDRLRECYGGQDPWWFETGEEWGEGAVYPHGVEDRFRHWHLDRVFRTYSELAKASQKMQFIALKYQIEQIRRHPSIVGYIITEFTDVNWESNGLLDMCRNPKIYYDRIRDVNRADALIPNWDRIDYWEGEQIALELVLSHFSDADLRGGRAEWQLQEFPELAGSFEDPGPEKARIAHLGEIVFQVPAVRDSLPAHLELKLYNTAGELMARNVQELYLYPRRAGQPSRMPLYASPALRDELRGLGYTISEELEGARLAVVDRMTDEMRWYIQKGGRVVWLAASQDSQQTYLHNLQIMDRHGHRWQGDWASNFNWLRQDRLFRAIPCDHLVDFGFADLTPEAVITGLGTRDFANNVHAGLFVGWIHDTVGLIAEQPFGNGELLACTFRLAGQLTSRPTAAIMLHDMVEYMAGRAERAASSAALAQTLNR